MAARRAPYLSYWSERAEKLEALIENPKLRRQLSRESWEGVRLAQEFAHHLDGILVFLQDVLISRKLEVHLNGDFQAVREALRQRMGMAE